MHGAASYLTTGRPLSRLDSGQRDQVLRRLATLGPDAGVAVEAMKAIVLLANGADTFAPELLSRAQAHVTARPDAPLNLISSTESRSMVTADAVIVGSGAGGAMVARTLARAGLDTVVLEEDAAGRSGNSAPLTRSTDIPACIAALAPPSHWDARPSSCPSAGRSEAPPS